MNILLWVLQVALAIHTAIGAVWKFSNSEQTIPALMSIPHSAWTALSIFEFLCSAGLLLPILNRRFMKLVPIAAIGIAIEMLFFSGLHLQSGASEHGPMIYWLAVATISGFIAYRRHRARIS